MKVSVIMSVFNGEKHVNASIESILNQTSKDLEFIIVDDGSKDNSLEIIKKYAKKDRRIKILENRFNIGLTKSLNKAIKYCKGEFIARQDVDDISMTKRLEKQINFLNKNPEYAFCGCNGFRKQNRNFELINIFKNDEIHKNLIVQNCFAHSSIVIKKEIFKAHGMYDEKFLYTQDYELWCRLIYKFQLKAKNLEDKLIMSNLPYNRFFNINIKKFLIQRINSIKVQFKYLKYTQYKFKCLIAIFMRWIEIFTLSYILGYFTKFLKKINF